MHLCADELVLLSAAIRAGASIMQCWVCLKVYFVEHWRIARPASAPLVHDEGYDWMSWHPDYRNEAGQVVWFDEPGGG